MAGQPVFNPLSQQAGGGGNNMEFFNSAAPAPTAFAPVQPPQAPTGGVQQPGAPVQPMQFFNSPGAAPGAGGVQQPGAGFGQPQVQQQAPGFFPAPQAAPVSYDDDLENEPPLLEELGIDLDHIWQRMQGVVFFKRLQQDVLQEWDLTGPGMGFMALNLCLMFQGKFELGYVYGFGLTGCGCICMLVNVMAQKKQDGQQGIDLYSTISILGYGLVPAVFLALIGIVKSLKGPFGLFAVIVCVVWSTATSSRFFASSICMQQQRWLVAYPVSLLYASLALLIVF